MTYDPLNELDRHIRQLREQGMSEKREKEMRELLAWLRSPPKPERGVDALLAELHATSYPYKWMSEATGIPYWATLSYWDQSPTGQAARELVLSQYIHKELDLRKFITYTEARFR